MHSCGKEVEVVWNFTKLPTNPCNFQLFLSFPWGSIAVVKILASFRILLNWPQIHTTLNIFYPSHKFYSHSEEDEVVWNLTKLTINSYNF